ncbi:MAG: V-type ATP synthase subunit I [Clostridia bacterium]|nr:V-type ATP synthase subunit I [Clostridia bacterium]
MAMVEMKKMFLVGHQNDKQEIVKRLQQMGNVEIISLENKIKDQQMGDSVEKDMDSEAVKVLDERIDKIKYSIDFISAYDNAKKGLFAGKEELTTEKYREFINDIDRFEDIYKQCSMLDGLLTEFKNEKNRLKNTKQQLEPWINLDVPLNQIQETETVSMSIGMVAKVDMDEFVDSVEKSGEGLAHIEILDSGKDEIYAFVIYHKSVSEQVTDNLKQHGWNTVSFPDIEDTPAEYMDKADRRFDDIEQEQRKIHEQAGSLAGELLYLKTLYDYLNVERQKKDIVKNFAKTQKTFILEGWVPEKHTDHIKGVISKITDAFVIEFNDPAEGEHFPVALNNPKLVEPFEAITELYSVPASDNIDPNPFMAPFYFVFFGMMLSDAGYGIILALATYFLIKKFRITGMARKLLLVIGLGGVSTLIWGAMFGGWFGVQLKPLWFTPMDESIKMLAVCFALGIIQIFSGMALQAYMNIRDGKVLDAVFDQGLWYVLIIGLILLAFVPSVGKIMSIIGAVGLILTQGRQQKGIFKKLMSGLGSLYNITGYLSDVLSYSRLFALGLATGVIAMVINNMASLLGTNPFGYILMVIILVAGHIFNILINVLGSFVHASRLQYIEFFGKFFEGGGKAFTPFRVNTKYIEIEEKEAV